MHPLARLAGHVATIAPTVVDWLRPHAPPPSEAFRTTLIDPDRGPTEVTGRLSTGAQDDVAIVVVHGLGGTAASIYLRRAATTARAFGVPSLRLNLRGADGQGDDLYHAGLTADLHAAVAALPHPRIVVLGYSLGGHVVLRAATEERLDPRVQAVAAISPPIDLGRAAAWIDRPTQLIYRETVLAGLRATHAAVHARRPTAIHPEEARSIRSLRDWDRRVIVPRFGFGTVENYYATAAVAPHLPQLRVPALLVHSHADPMIPDDAVLPATHGIDKLTVHTTPAGGHVVLPTDLGWTGPGMSTEGVVGWLLARCPR